MRKRHRGDIRDRTPVHFQPSFRSYQTAMPRPLSRFRFLLLLVACISCGSVRAAQPNVLFLLADDQRPDTVGALGNERTNTPALDQLAARGMAFTRASCSYPICVVSRAEILTGRHGWENGIDGLNGNRFRDGLVFWGEALQQSGYRTWYVGKWHTSGRPSQRGYDEVRALFAAGGSRWWSDDHVDWKGDPVTGYRAWIFQNDAGTEKYPALGVGLTPDIDARFADAAIEVIEQDHQQPWFLHVNFTAPHDPLLLPPRTTGRYRAEDMQLPPNFLPQHPFDHGNFDGRDELLMQFPRTPSATKDLLSVYYAVVDHLDLQVGRILASLRASGQLDNTIVIYASDHGLAVASHGLRGKQNMYEHTINVPLIIAGPGIPTGAVSDAQVYLRDLYPTTCELVGASIPPTVTADSFAPVLLGRQSSHHEATYGYFRDTQRMVRTDRWKYIEYPQVKETQLFDLLADPHEMHNLAGDESVAETQSSLASQLHHWQAATGDPYR